MRAPHTFRRRRGARATARACIAVAALGLAACSEAPRGAGPPLVVVTIHPVADLVARVGGAAIRVETLLPPRASVHTWAATPRQIRSLSRAAGFVTVGGGLDGWLDDVGGASPTCPASASRMGSPCWGRNTGTTAKRATRMSGSIPSWCATRSFRA